MNPKSNSTARSAGGSFLNRMSIRAKLLSLVGVLLATVATIGVNGYLTISNLAAGLEVVSVNDISAQKNMDLADMMHDGLRAVAFRSVIAAQRNALDEKKASAEELTEFTTNIN
ncbi:MAG: hypothetical protein RLZZ15_2431, partial [Verrucomicrobiota bacterium]